MFFPCLNKVFAIDEQSNPSQPGLAINNSTGEMLGILLRERAYKGLLDNFGIGTGPMAAAIEIRYHLIFGAHPQIHLLFAEHVLQRSDTKRHIYAGCSVQLDEPGVINYPAIGIGSAISQKLIKRQAHIAAIITPLLQVFAAQSMERLGFFVPV
tara:strand:- start:91 stop:552 length:462 start_codon:yes stop_codon:yes gene_type:complete